MATSTLQTRHILLQLSFVSKSSTFAVVLAASNTEGTIALPLTGGCQCGILRYEISILPRLVFACHCQDCQRITSSAFSLGLCLLDTPFELIGPHPRLIQRVAKNGAKRNRWVCPNCGSWLCGGSRPGASTPDRIRLLRGGSLDDTRWLRPTLHFWVKRKQPWVILPEGSVTFETQPPKLYEYLMTV